MLGETVRNEVEGDTAYVVARVVLSYRQHGKSMAEPAEMAIALRNGTGSVEDH
jgi:hypothetical protein